jgi:putative tryptophan/tyrosine transport system substrate-binding protein
MKRREFITLVGGAATASVSWPLAARAQQQAKVQRIGFLGFGTAAARANRVEALRAGLRKLGYVEDKNIIIEFRWTERIDRLPELAAELVRMNVDLIFATSSTEVEAARRATETIPIVFATHADPVGLGHVASLPRPGGNITGLTMLLTDLAAKELEILKEAVPQATQIAVLITLTAPSHRPALQAIKAAGEKLGVQIQMVPVQTAEDLDGAFASMSQARAGGLLVVASALTRSQHTRLAELALRHRLPSMFGTRDNVEAGGLMSYAPDLADLTRRAATYIDKILKGAKPADLPVEQASKYQLVINLKTAKAIGVDLPPLLLTRADEVIE